MTQQDFHDSRDADKDAHHLANEVANQVAEQIALVTAAASQLDSAEQAVKSLPLGLPKPQQGTVVNLVMQLRLISADLAHAAAYNAATAHRISAIIHTRSAEIDDCTPIEEQVLATLKGLTALTKLANDASEIPLNMLRANKDLLEEMGARENSNITLPDSAIPLDIAEASRTYQDFIVRK